MNVDDRMYEYNWRGDGEDLKGEPLLFIFSSRIIRHEEYRLIGIALYFVTVALNIIHTLG